MWPNLPVVLPQVNDALSSILSNPPESIPNIDRVSHPRLLNYMHAPNLQYFFARMCRLHALIGKLNSS